MAEYTSDGDKLHMAYCFELLGKQKSAPFLHATFSRFLRIVGTGWPCWALSNHDVTRVATRWGGDTPNPQLLRLAAAMQMALRGTPCIYQGDELGLPEADIAFEDLQDPFGITMWPKFKGRDGCRTPMPWSANQSHAGFGPAKPWLPVPAAHLTLAVDQQSPQPDSLLNYYTQLLHWRRQQAALVKGEMTMLDAHDQVLAFVRQLPQQTLLCVFNFSDTPVVWTLPAAHAGAQLHSSPLAGAQQHGTQITLAPWGGAFLAV